MTLALVQAIVAILLTTVATWTGLLVSVAFLLPRAAARAEQTMAASPWKCFLPGLGLAVVMVLGLLIAQAGHPIIKLFGLTVIMAVGTLMTIGSAGIAQTIGKRGEPEGAIPTFGMLVRGSLVYSLAIGFPLVGWFVFAPLALITAMGAGLMALIPDRRTMMTPPAHSDYDLGTPTALS